MKTVSFVMPVYNPPEDRLRGQLDSILSQTGADVELVAVDDGSTNGVLSVLREYEGRNPGRMKIVSRENRGAGPSRNEGFLAATGDYVWFVDCDDEIRPDCLGELVEIMEKTGADQLLLNSSVAKSGVREPFPDRPDASIREVSKAFAFANFYRAPWKRLLRRDFLARIGVSFCNVRTGQEDQPETARWLLESDRLFYANKGWYRYSGVPTSLSHSAPSPDALETGRLVNDLFRDLASEFPEHREWMDFFSYLAARQNFRACTDAIRKFAKDPSKAEIVARYRSVREDYRRTLSALPEERTLVHLYDKGCRVGTSGAEAALLPKIARLEETVGKLRRRAERAEAAAAAFRARAAAAAAARDAVRNSLSWRLTAPVRALLRPFAKKRD